MTDDNIVSFPGVDKPKGDDSAPNADAILEAAKGQYEDVILIGLGPNKQQCVSTVSIEEAVYELSRAIYKLHIFTDTQYRR